VDERDATDAPSLTVFSSEGTVMDASASGHVGAGSWAPVDSTTGLMTLVHVFEGGGGGLSGSGVIRATIEIDDAGNTFIARYSYNEVAADGAVVRSLTSIAKGVRVPVEPVEHAGTALQGFPVVGTPVGASPSP
jgi:hypothetical protein